MTITNILPFIIYAIIITCLFLLFPASLSTVALFLVGYITWLGGEYVYHRFVFHNSKIPRKVKKRVTHGHAFHHKNPDIIDHLFIPLYLTLPNFLFLLFSFMFIFGTEHSAWFGTGMVFGWVQYEVLHYAAHHWNLPGVFKYLKRYHLSHHTHHLRGNYMVSNPLLDVIFRTKKVV